MTDTELNEAVAVKLGVSFTHPGYMGDPPIKDYCHSIAAAWEVVEYLSKHYFSVSVSHDDERDLWQCAYEMREDLAIFATADTAPMAICEAFLKLESSHGKNIKANPDPKTRRGSKAPNPK